MTILDIGRAEALFCCDRSTDDPMTREDAEVAIRAAVLRHTVRGCARRMAQEFGDHPDTAARRMRWAVAAVAALFGRPAGGEIVWSVAA